MAGYQAAADPTMFTPEMMHRTLGRLGAPLWWDPDAEEWITPDPTSDDFVPRVVDENEIHHLVTRSETEPGSKPLPTYAKSGQKAQYWHGYRYNYPKPAAMMWVETLREFSQSFGPTDGFHPKDLPVKMWPSIPEQDHRLCGAVMLNLMVGTIARIHDAYDIHVWPMLRGPLGCGKSKFVEMLLPERFVHLEFPIESLGKQDGDRKIAHHMLDKLLAEVPEIKGMDTPAKAAKLLPALKALVTKSRDRADLKFKGAKDRVRRWCVIFTTNTERPIPYDPAGNRRFVVFDIGERNPDVTKDPAKFLPALRHLYWAHAIAIYDGFVAKGLDHADISQRLAPQSHPWMMADIERQNRQYMAHPHEEGDELRRIRTYANPPAGVSR